MPGFLGERGRGFGNRTGMPLHECFDPGRNFHTSGSENIEPEIGEGSSVDHIPVPILRNREADGSGGPGNNFPKSGLNRLLLEKTGSAGKRNMI